MKKDRLIQLSFFSEKEKIEMAKAPREWPAKAQEPVKESQKPEGEEVIEPEVPEWLQRSGVSRLQAVTNGSQRGAPND
ncbi:hypothetical protein HYS03_02495 [Candidatus Woesebacteria bacterium]|nr:hypothetical protein [Candidatus Woesebacteria bacterium]QQG47556.1 MAG: hypothetical protein HY044_00485 [Candidatus Woesebacteria bacterium]